MRILKAVLVIPLVVVILVLAVANRADVVVVLDPLGLYPSFSTLVVPLYALLFGAAGLGVVIGGVAMWWSHRSMRERARFFEREALVLREELDQVRHVPRPSSVSDKDLPPPLSMIR